MAENLILRRGSLVLYKTHPARVNEIGDKLEIEVQGGGVQKVRPKDVVVLHPGPIDSLNSLRPEKGDVQTAWELLDGAETNLKELADLIYGRFSPSTAWAAWQWVVDGLYFHGTPEAITSCSPADVERERAHRQTKAAEAQAWEDFLAKAHRGAKFNEYTDEDRRFLREVEDLAFDRRQGSRILRGLGRPETPQSAHAFLLDIGAWDYTINPYPARFKLPVSQPDFDLPGLADDPRVDLTHLPAFAIDDEGNQEPDDALSIEGGRVWVHVADVSSLVPPGSPADVEARMRGANLYLPEGPVHILPPKIIPLLGLGMQDVSPALSFGIDLTPEGEIARVEIMPSRVRVERITYQQAQDRITEEPFASLLRHAMRYQKRRKASGAINIDLPEVKVWVENGQVKLRRTIVLDSRVLVRESMLMAGEAVARYAVEHNIPLPFATQDRSPDIGVVPEDLAGRFAARRKLIRAQVSSHPGLHAGLGLDAYTRATSPLRRYLDLVVHQQLRAHLLGGELLDEQAVLARVGESEAITGSVNQAEERARRHWLMVYLMQNPNWRGASVVVEKNGPRYKTILPDLAIDTNIHLRHDTPLNSEVLLENNGVNLPELDAYFHVVKE